MSLFSLEDYFGTKYPNMNPVENMSTGSSKRAESPEMSLPSQTKKTPEVAQPESNFHTEPVGGCLTNVGELKETQAQAGDRFSVQSGSEPVIIRPQNLGLTTMPSAPHFANVNGIGAGEPSGICDIFLIGVSYLLVICTLPLSLFFCFKVVQEYERAVIFRLGRLSKGGARGPGLFFILPCTDNYCKCDLRTVSFNVPPQEVLSKDSVTVSVDAVVYYRIQNATIAVSNVANYDSSTQLLAATTLRTVLGTKSLSEILSEREHISHVMQSSLDEATAPWGIKVERVEIKDVRLPQQMQRAMAAEAEAQREARAKVIAAEGEQRASRALKEAADVISDSPGALQLRYLQTLTSIAAEKNSTVVFPLPMELMRGLGMGK